MFILGFQGFSILYYQNFKLLPTLDVNLFGILIKHHGVNFWVKCYLRYTPPFLTYLQPDLHDTPLFILWKIYYEGGNTLPIPLL